MTRKTVHVVISLPTKLVERIEDQKGDYPRSTIFRKLLELGLESCSTNNTKIFPRVRSVFE